MTLPETMTAAVFAGEGQLAIVKRPIPRVSAPDDVLLKIEACGVCGTDLRFLSVPPVLACKPGVILGHEYVGQVLAVGAGVRHLAPGDRVAVMPDLPCGHCRTCVSGHPNLCEHTQSIGGDLDGGFADYALAPAHGLTPIPTSIPAEQAAFIELMTCVSGGVRKAAPMPGESVLIVGAGPAGLTYMKLFRAAGVGQVIMAEVNPWRAAFALEHGADHVIDPRQEDPAQAIRRHTHDGAEIVVDAVGSALETAIACAGRAGRIIVFGEDAGARCTVRPYDIQHRELRILGSFIGLDQYPLVIQMLESGAVQMTDLITHRLSLAQLPEGIKELAAGRGAKGVCLL